MTDSNLILKQQKFGDLVVPVIGFASPKRGPLALAIAGTIVNSVTERKESLQAWKVKIASEVKAGRGMSSWDPSNDYVVTLVLRFHPENHGHRRLDAENFVKPIIDALAAGLFCEAETNPGDISHWNYDDSNFRTILIHRLSDASGQEEEKAVICASAR